MVFMHFGAAIQNLNRGFTDVARSMSRSRTRRDGPVKLSRPDSFKTYRDPKGLFVLEYPSDWTLRRGRTVQVNSDRLGSFARVDVVPFTSTLWRDLMAAMAREGTRVTIEKRNGSKPVHVRGKVKVSSTRFSWNAYAYRNKDQKIILSLGNVIDSRRSRMIERYEDRVLAAIRREFSARTS